MAERRMFAKTIIDSDAFLDMPLSTQALYFHLSMRADDDGFINNPRKIQRMIGCNDDDLRVLISKKFIIPFESGIVVIKHWRIHNYIQKDRYKPTIYQEERAMLSLKENNVYTENQEPVSSLDTGCIHDVSNSDTQDRLGKDSLGEVSTGKDSQVEGKEDKTPAAPAAPHYDYDSFKDTYNNICTSLSSVRILTDKRKKAIKAFLKDFTLDQFREICMKANASGFLTGQNDRAWKADFDFLLRPDKAAKILEGGYDNGDRKQEVNTNGGNGKSSFAERNPGWHPHSCTTDDDGGEIDYTYMPEWRRAQIRANQAGASQG